MNKRQPQIFITLAMNQNAPLLNARAAKRPRNQKWLRFESWRGIRFIITGRYLSFSQRALTVFSTVHTFNREFLAAFPITTSFASSIVSTKIFIRCCFTPSAGIAWKNLFVIWKKGAKLRGNVWNKTKASGSQHTRFNSIYLNLTGVSKNGRMCPKSDKSPKIEWNRPKSNGTVRKQAKMSDTRRNLPIPDGSFWNGMWNEMWKVFETRREMLKIGRNYSKLHVSVRNRLFLSCLEGEKNHSSCYQCFWWIRCDKTLLIYCFQTGRKDSF